MKPASAILEMPPPRLSDEGKSRLLSVRGEPLFLAAWEHALFVHYEIDPDILQPELPFQLDLRDGRAFISQVAFTMRDMRPRVGGKMTALLFRPIATHSFLNLRTYVKHRGESGICFISEWLTNRLSVALGPAFYGLPYHFAKIIYRHANAGSFLHGEVCGKGGKFIYGGELTDDSCAPCESDSLDEFLLERYTAFNWHGNSRRFFRVWHPPWPQVRACVSISDNSLLVKKFPWFGRAAFVGANYSPGFGEVWMGRAHACCQLRG
jgi:uncharacterized protein YqjF (DUF2071 family)